MVGGAHFQDEIETPEETEARLAAEKARLERLRAKYGLRPNAGEFAIFRARVRSLFKGARRT